MYFLGIDGGTSGCRAVVVDSDGKPVITAKHELTLSDTALDANRWWQATEACLDEIFGKFPARQIKGISVDGTSGSVVLCDAQGEPISPALLYNDSRAVEAVAYLRQHAPKDSPAQGMGSALAKLIYLLETHPNPSEKRALLHTDWILTRLGAPLGLSDWNNCLKLGFDPVSLSWPDWIKHTPVPPSVLPKPIRPGSALGPVANAVEQRWGLESGCPLYAGTTDSIAAFLATGARAGDGVTSLGTTLAIKMLSPRPIFNADFGVYSHRLNDRWLVGGASNSGGGVLQRFFTSQQLTALSKKIDPQVDSGLDYYPLNKPGERFPINDAALSPNMQPRPQQDELYLQGLFEGMAKIESLAYQRLQDLGAGKPHRILTVGGGAVNPVWQEIRRRYLGLEVITAPHQEAAYGAALIAKAGAAKVGLI